MFLACDSELPVLSHGSALACTYPPGGHVVHLLVLGAVRCSGMEGDSPSTSSLSLMWFPGQVNPGAPVLMTLYCEIADFESMSVYIF